MRNQERIQCNSLMIVFLVCVYEIIPHDLLINQHAEEESSSSADDSKEILFI